MCVVLDFNSDSLLPNEPADQLVLMKQSLLLPKPITWRCKQTTTSMRFRASLYFGKSKRGSQEQMTKMAKNIHGADDDKGLELYGYENYVLCLNSFYSHGYDFQYIRHFASEVNHLSDFVQTPLFIFSYDLSII